MSIELSSPIESLQDVSTIGHTNVSTLAETRNSLKFPFKLDCLAPTKSEDLTIDRQNVSEGYLSDRQRPEKRFLAPGSAYKNKISNKEKSHAKLDFIASTGNRRDSYFRTHHNELRYSLVTQEMLEHNAQLDDENDRSVSPVKNCSYSI